MLALIKRHRANNHARQIEAQAQQVQRLRDREYQRSALIQDISFIRNHMLLLDPLPHSTSEVSIPNKLQSIQHTAPMTSLGADNNITSHISGKYISRPVSGSTGGPDDTSFFADVTLVSTPPPCSDFLESKPCNDSIIVEPITICFSECDETGSASLKHRVSEVHGYETLEDALGLRESCNYLLKIHQLCGYDSDSSVDC